FSVLSTTFAAILVQLSVPTRRSSDLVTMANCHRAASTASTGGLLEIGSPVSVGTPRDHEPGPKAQSRAGRRRSPCAPARLGLARSEEHTSELQSRFDLVCRLLLQKKT